MKLSKIYIPVAGLLMGAMGMTSCNDDFLEVYPQTSLTDQNAFQSYDNFRAYMYNCYGLFTNTSIWTNHGGGSYYWSGLYNSDFYSGIITNREGTTQTSLNPYAWQNITVTTTSGNWDFSPIRTVNIMLEHLDDSSLSETEKNHWRAVGYFFHSWWYMELVNKYGDIPYITKVLTDESEEAYGPRTPRAEVVENIIERLEYAIANIGDTSKDGDNCVTADAARAALSRFLLREATWAKYHGLNEPYQQYLEKCLTVSQELMNKYPTLYYGKGTNKYPAAGYDEEYTTENLTGVPGIIMFKEYTSPLAMHRFSDLIHVEAHRADAPQHTVDMFLMANGKPINNPNSGFHGGEGKDLYDYFYERDPRLYVNFQPPAAGYIANFSNPDNVITFKKWRYYEAGEKLNGGNFTIDDEYAEKLRRYIDYLGPNVYCENGTGDETLGCKRLPGHNWGGTMSHGSPNLNSSQTDNYMRCLSGYYFWKEYTMWENGNNDYFQTSDKPIFAINEVLLNYAEAAWELGRFTQSVADITINKLRERAGVAPMNVGEITADFDPDRDKGNNSWTVGYDNKTNYEVDPVLWEIRRERMVELMGLGHSFYDIRRWHKAPYYVNRQPCGMWLDKDNFPYGNGTYGYTLVDYNEIKNSGYSLSNPNATKGWAYTGGGCLSTGKGWLDAYYLWMVPTHEINMNPNLTQNPGYEALFGSAGAGE